MLFGFFQIFFLCLLWGLGLQGSATKGASGFGEDELVRKRELTAFERILKATCTGLFILSTLANFSAPFDFLFETESYWCALPSAAWILFMLFRRSVPMDAEAIGTGLWTFAPFVSIGLWSVSGFLQLDLIPYHSLLWQAVGVGAMIAYGLTRDISREMNPPS
jgi:FtsH-binding integral membrane protein